MKKDIDAGPLFLAGLKPSKKKVMNLITKGKYSSGKKKDLFDDLEQSFQPGKGGESESEEPATPSAEWQAYQNMTARVEQTMGAARQKITPLQTPSSPPSDNSLHPSPARPAPPSRPVSPMPKSNVDDLLAVLDQPAQEEGKKSPGPPGRPPPPKGKPGRPPPPKKAETPTTAQVTSTNLEVTNTQVQITCPYRDPTLSLCSLLSWLLTLVGSICSFPLSYLFVYRYVDLFIFVS